MKVLFLFLDGVGLGSSDADINPFVTAKLPCLTRLLAGRRLVHEALPWHTEYASLFSLDACLGVTGIPQSATGQAALITGMNVPAILGYHFGPKPNQDVVNIVRKENLFNSLAQQGYKTALLNAYPPSYFQKIASGKRMYSTIPLAITSAGITLKTHSDLYAREALSADFTGQGWREQLGFTDLQVLGPRQAGQCLGKLAQKYDLAFFEYWLPDYIGHCQDRTNALQLLETFDNVLDGLLEVWNIFDDLILITSDHGNLEDLSTHRHTHNPVPALLIGSSVNRMVSHNNLHDITDITPWLMQVMKNS